MKSAGVVFALGFAGLASAAPPSSVLTGDTGTLTWTVTSNADGVKVVGTSPDWSVTHLARADLTPVHTVRTAADGRVVTIDYTATGATVTLPDKTLTHDHPGLWDVDTVDIRLGQLSVSGDVEVRFSAIDPDSGKVYGFETQVVGSETCGSRSCTHVKMTLTGMLKMVGPKFHYWFAADGRLLRFSGPDGEFRAG